MITRRGSHFPAGVNSVNAIATIPAGVQPGDLLLLMWTTAGNGTTTDPAGWTRLGSAQGSADTQLVVLLSRIAQAGDAGSPVTCVLGPTASRQGVALVAYYSTIGLVTVAASAVAPNTLTAPALAGGQAVVRGAGIRQGTNVPTWTMPASHTEVGRESSAGSGGKAWAIAERFAADTATATFVPSEGTNNAAWTAALIETEAEPEPEPVGIQIHHWNGTVAVPMKVMHWNGTVATELAWGESEPVAELSPLVTEMTSPFIISHRAGGFQFPENTLYSADRAFIDPEVAIEVDVVPLTTGQGLAMSHDTTIDRTSHAGTTGNVASYSAAGFRALRQTWPPESDVVDQPAVYGGTWSDLADKWGGKRIIMAEGKTAAATTAVIADIVARGIQSRCMFTAFNRTQCQQAHAAGIATVQVFSAAPDLATVQTDGFYGVSLYTTYATLANIDDANTRGIKVFVLQVVGTSQMATYMGRGAFGFVTDEPWILTGAPTPPAETSLSIPLDIPVTL